MTTAASGGGVANTRNHSRGRIAAVNKQTDGANYSGESRTVEPVPWKSSVSSVM